MKTNIFSVKKKDKKRIVIEEDRYKNPLLLFLSRHKSFIIMMIGLILLMIMLISTGLAFSLFGTTTDFDVVYVKGDEIVEPIADPEIDDEDIMTAITGTNNDGVVVLMEKFMTSGNDIISYFSDGTAIIVKADGSIYKVYPNKNYEYGVDKNGKIASDVIWGKLTSRTNTLSDGTIITYYSDNSAVIEHNGTTIYARNGKKINSNNAYFIEVNPSGVAIETETKNVKGDKAIKFTDGSYLIIKGDKKYIVNKNTPVTVTDDKITYSKHNTFGTIKVIKLKDGNTITYFEDGSAVIENKDGKYIYVNRSADIFMRENTLYEIVTNNKGYSTFTKYTTDGVKVTYYDNGAAVITDNNKRYVVDSNNIIYDEEGRIIKVDESTSNTKETGKMTSGEQVTNFENNKSEVINSDGSSYITDSNTIRLIDNNEKDDKKTNNNNNNNNKDNDNSDDNVNTDGDASGGTGTGVDKEGIYVSDSVDSYNYSKSIETTVFTISNRFKKSRSYRIVIEEVSDYSKFKVSRLEPKYVKVQALIGGEYISSKPLTTDIWTTPEGKDSFVLYDGVIEAKSKTTVNLSLNVDYAPLDNSYQNKGFLGTIKVYLVEDEN